jgi:hypothetical protein
LQANLSKYNEIQASFKELQSKQNGLNESL